MAKVTRTSIRGLEFKGTVLECHWIYTIASGGLVEAELSPAYFGEGYIRSQRQSASVLGPDPSIDCFVVSEVTEAGSPALSLEFEDIYDGLGNLSVHFCRIGG